MADNHTSVSASPTLNSEEDNAAARHESKKMDAESASLDTTHTTMDRNTTGNNNENEKENHTFNHHDDTEDEEEVSQKVNDATAGQADLTRTTSTVHYVEGMRLHFLMASMTLIFFLVMIDITIVSTVSSISRKLEQGMRLTK